MKSNINNSRKWGITPGFCYTLAGNSDFSHRSNVHREIPSILAAGATFKPLLDMAYRTTSTFKGNRGRPFLDVRLWSFTIWIALVKGTDEAMIDERF